LFKPKDVVSGDFYWWKHLGNYTIITAADCTGHGVPGAFMSLIAGRLLDETITYQKVTDPAEILEVVS